MAFKKNQIKFKDFLKAIEVACCKFETYNFINKPGSGIRIELFKNKKDLQPFKMWVVHREKYVHKGDLEKTIFNLEISESDFLKIIDNL